jgi:mono/diheme cytochrome c family protein
MRALLRKLRFATLLLVAAGAATAAEPPLPARLSDTGLYAPGSTTRSGDRVQPYSPQYPLWSDGTRKRRWIYLPPGTAIDASQPDAWEFPPGTRLWKEFAYGRPVETRYLERLDDGRWRFATYLWNADGRDAVLAPEGGAVLDAGPTGRYRVPSRADCLACHEGPAVPVLGFSALQLSPDRDPLALHAESPRAGDADLRTLVAGRYLVNLPPALLATPPRIAAPTAAARAALGYLHGNCGHCHGPDGALDGLDLSLAQRADSNAGSVARTLQSLLDRPSRFRPPGVADARRVALDARNPSTLLLRLGSTSPLARMPPLGVQVIDAEGVALVERWINEQQHH